MDNNTSEQKSIAGLRAKAAVFFLILIFDRKHDLTIKLR